MHNGLQSGQPQTLAAEGQLHARLHTEAQGAGAATAALLPAALWPGTWPSRAEIPVLKEMEFDSMKAPLQPVRPPLVVAGTAAWLVPQGWREIVLLGLGQGLRVTHGCGQSVQEGRTRDTKSRHGGQRRVSVRREGEFLFKSNC